MTFLLFVLILFFSITFHEYAHGWVAYRLGDPTPRVFGRLSLNPLTHIDPFGTIILPIFLLIMSRGTFSFGYAKPVPINPYHFKTFRKDMMLVGIAGPLTNFIIAFSLSLILEIGVISFFSEIIIWGIVINLILAIFNLVPIPPLDGSKIAAFFLPYRLSYNYLKMETAGFFIITFLVMIGFFERVILPLVKVTLFFLGIT